MKIDNAAFGCAALNNEVSTQISVDVDESGKISFESAEDINRAIDALVDVACPVSSRGTSMAPVWVKVNEEKLPSRSASTLRIRFDEDGKYLEFSTWEDLKNLHRTITSMLANYGNKDE